MMRRAYSARATRSEMRGVKRRHDARSRHAVRRHSVRSRRRRHFRCHCHIFV